MVEEIKNKRASMLVFSGMFGVLAFFLLSALLADSIDDYAGIVVTREIDSTANFLVLIYSIAILAIVIVANQLSDVDILISEISGLASFIFTMFFLTLISYVTLGISYPQIFMRNGIEVQWYEIALDYSLINTKFAIYILKSTQVYFFIVLGTMIFTSFLLVNAFGGFKHGQAS